MSEYYISYEQNVPWNGTVFNANEYRKAINAFYSKIDLVNPNAIVDDDAPQPNISIKNLSPDANFPNEWGFSLSGKFSTSKRDELTGEYLAYVNLSSDVKIPRQTSTDKTLRTIIAASFKSTRAIGKTPSEAFDNAFKQLRESILQTLTDQVSGKDIKVERQEPFTDTEPALPGPPTQTISGVTNKAPVVDNPNIKLPTQEVKSLTATSATDAVGQAKSSATNTLNQAQGSVSELTSQAQSAASSATGQVQSVASGATNQVQNATSGLTSQAQSAVGGVQQSAGGILSNLSSGVTGALGGGALGAGIGALAGGGKGALIGAGAGVLTGGIVGSVVDKLNPKGIKPDGLGKDWSPDKFSPEAIAGNDKFIDPKTGTIGSTSKLAAGLKGGLLGGGLGAGIGGLVGGGKGAVIGAVSGGAVGAAVAKLASVQKGLPKPNIPKPTNTPRIKTVKIPRPDNTKGAQALLNLPKSPLG